MNLISSQTRVTQSDIAARVKRSRKVVSQALRGDPGVSAETREEIWRAAQELGYRGPRERTGRFGVVATQVLYQSMAMQGLFEAASDEGFSLELRITGSSKLAELQAITELDALQIEGLILLSPRVTIDRLRPYISQRRPIIAVNGGLTERPGLVCLETPNREAGAAVMRALLERGHRHFAYLTGDPNSRTGSLRLEGFRETFHDWVGSDVDNFLHIFTPLGDEIGYAGGYRACEKLLYSDLKSNITAIVAATDLFAIGAIRKLREQNFRIPDDYSVVGMGGMEATAFTDPPLATVELPEVSIGGEAVRKLISVLDGEVSDPERATARLRTLLRPQWRASLGNARSIDRL